jgi:hypothetical protein
MKDKQVIEKLQLLRSVKPDEETVRVIHEKSTAQLFGAKRYNTHKWFTIPPLVPIIAFAVILIFFSVVTGFLPNIIHQTVITSEIALASNHYEKAKIAVSDAESQFSFVKQHPTDANKVAALSHSLALANLQMTKLQLKGEKGKYTMKDCLTLYTSYYNTLESMRKTVNSQKNPSDEENQLRREINEYDVQAEKKLHLYKS